MSNTPSLFCCSFCGKSRDECIRTAAELIGKPDLMAPFDARCSAGAIAAVLDAAAAVASTPG